MAHNSKGLYKAAKRQGWTYTTGRNCHLKWKCPCGSHIVTTSATTSNRHAVRNMEKDFKRTGCFE